MGVVSLVVFFEGGYDGFVKIFCLWCGDVFFCNVSL